MNATLRSLPNIVRLFIAISVVAAGIGASTAHADDVAFNLVPDYTVSVANQGTCGDNPTVSNVTMTPQDEDGNVVDPGMGVRFILPQGSPVVILGDPVVTTPDADGSYSIQVSSPTPGVFEVGGELTDGSHRTSVRIPFRNAPLDQDLSSVTVTDGTRFSDNNDAHQVTITLVSQCGLPIDLAMAQSDALSVSAVDAVSGAPVTVSSPPEISTGPGLTLVGYFQTSPGTYTALLVSNQPGTYNLTVTFNEQSSYGSLSDRAITLKPNPLAVRFILDASDSSGTLTVDRDTATATVVDGEGTPAQGVEVIFQIDGSARFDNGETTITTTTDESGQATGAITPLTDGCHNAEYDVSAYFQTGDAMLELNGSPIHVNAAPAPGDCHYSLTVINANSYRIAGTAWPGAEVRVDDASGVILGSVTADGQGAWEMDTPASTRSQQITVTMLDNADSVTAWLDTDLPDPPRVDRADGTEVAGDLGAAEPFALVSIVFPDMTQGSATAAENGSYSIATPPDMSDGVVTAYQSDTAGNASGPTVADLVVTPVPPQPPVPPEPPTPPAQCSFMTLVKIIWTIKILKWLF